MTWNPSKYCPFFQFKSTSQNILSDEALNDLVEVKLFIWGFSTSVYRFHRIAACSHTSNPTQTGKYRQFGPKDGLKMERTYDRAISRIKGYTWFILRHKSVKHNTFKWEGYKNYAATRIRTQEWHVSLSWTPLNQDEPFLPPPHIHIWTHVSTIDPWSSWLFSGHASSGPKPSCCERSYHDHAVSAKNP